MKPTSWYVWSLGMSPVTTADETRSKFLEVAFEEIHKNGFQGTSINQIIEKAEMTKGALFHHFKSKVELGYHVIDEVVAEVVYVSWIKPIQASDDPCETIMEILLCLSSEKTQEELACGCPLNNLAQEMSPLDEGFRTRIKAIYDRWIAAIADAFERAKSKGTQYFIY